jgi:hypothetical protein
LVYLTRHARGIAVFMAASEKLEIVQRQAREYAKKEQRVSRTGQYEFEFDDGLKNIEDVDLTAVKLYWLRKLASGPHRFGIEQLADMIEETGWFESDFQSAFAELANQGMVANLDDKTNRRKKKYVHFDAYHNQGEQLIRLKS